MTKQDADLIDRLGAPTPKFFKKIIKIGLTIGAIGGGLLAIPTSIVLLPAAIITAAGYMAATGTVAAFVAKTAVDWDKVNN
jgi:hypothetical protein